MTNPTTMTTYPAVVGAFLASKRKEIELSQGDIAEKVGLTVSSWSRIESGEAALTIEQLALAAKALSMSPGQLLMTIDAITVELSKKGIGTNIERASADAIAASGAIPLVGAGLASTVNIASLAKGATKQIAIPIIAASAAGAVVGLYNWLSYKDKKDKA